MHIRSMSDVDSPLVTAHGEIVYELVGRGVGEPTERHSVAHIVLPRGKSSLLHYHPEAEESYYILKGRARIRLGDEEATIGPGQTVLISPPKPHKIFSVGEEDLEFLAFCVPAWEPTNTNFLEKWSEEPSPAETGNAINRIRSESVSTDFLSQPRSSDRGSADDTFSNNEEVRDALWCSRAHAG